MNLYEDTRSIFEDNSTDNGYSWGLDWGTSLSCMACFQKDSGQPPVVPEYSHFCQGGVPSLFARTADGTERVADEVKAYDELSNNPSGVCASVKTRLKEKEVVLHGHTYAIRDIAVRIVQRVLQVNQDLFEQLFYPTEIPSLVVGVPVRFTAAERAEVQSIVQEALGDKPVRLVPEPILAALAIDYFLKRVGRTADHPLLIYDMGAGTFDTVVLLPNPHPTQENPYPYLALHPLGSHLAGDRMDQHMTELILDKVRENPGNLDLEILTSENHQDHIKLATETACSVKERLSQVTETDVVISGIRCGSGTVHVTRAEFEARILADVQTNVNLSVQAVQNSNLWGCKELEILLVGGSSSIPLVRSALAETFDWLESSHIQSRLPLKAVAMGAAIYAANPEAVLPKVAYGYAVDTYHTEKKRSMLHVRIASNAKLPSSIKGTYYTRFDNQDSVSFPVYEVEHGEANEYLENSAGRQLMYHNQCYQILHHFNRKVPKGTRVDLTVTLDANGILTMEVDDLGITSSVTRDTISLSNITT